MPVFESGNVRIDYEERGSGFPVLMMAAGGMASHRGKWYEAAPWHPWDDLAGDYRMIAMSQRNAGDSFAPVSSSDDWDTYVDDQLALMDHLGIERFHTMGMCIGVSYALAIIRRAPERVASLVAFQPIGMDDDRQIWFDFFDGWKNEIAADHPEADEAAWTAFRENMYGTDFLFSVSPEFVEQCQTPMLVLMGLDKFHPEVSSRQLASLAPNATLVERWKDPAAQPAAKAAIAAFLREHTPAG